MTTIAYKDGIPNTIWLPIVLGEVREGILAVLAGRHEAIRIEVRLGDIAIYILKEDGGNG